MAETDEKVGENLQEANLASTDRARLVWESKITDKTTASRAAGSDMTAPLFQRAAENGWRIYFLGGAAGMAEATAIKAKNEFPGLQLAGAEGPITNLGNHAETMKVVSRIKDKYCDLLLVGLGCPKQELFLSTYLEESGAKVGIGVGGFFDFI
ncbi:MAG: N-acetylglucosaminyldiphosphoundecaprenol N-acetyl-beta-D-mannosaminyltransferase [Planctomycetota bacterium]